MIGALKGCRHVLGWEVSFIRAIKNGYSEKTAANAAGVSTIRVHELADKDENFKKKYEEAWAGRRERARGGPW